ncbi:Hypothetical_protein [Hexamita inflata]|uniref:Hypothetical_protein n=1 Tax=Hexamita inflata TaxID=28002 RepID=A0AA86UID9_9EUKA|nr:Hypothetical protein HINF_LOCUS40067 [Hexamita inflata]
MNLIDFLNNAQSPIQNIQVTQQLQEFLKDNDDDNSLRIINKLKMIPQPTVKQVLLRYKAIVVNEIQKETSEQPNNHKDLFIIIFKSIQILKSQVIYQLVPCVIHTYILFIAVVPQSNSKQAQPLIMTKPAGKVYFKDQYGEYLHTIPYTRSGNIVHHVNSNQLDNRPSNLITTFNNKLVHKDHYKYFITRTIWMTKEDIRQRKLQLLEQQEQSNVLHEAIAEFIDDTPKAMLNVSEVESEVESDNELVKEPVVEQIQPIETEEEQLQKKLIKIKVNKQLSREEHLKRINKSWQGNVAYSQHMGLHRILQTFHQQMFFQNCFELDSNLNLEPSFYTTFLEDPENLNNYEQYQYMLDNTYTTSFIFTFDKFYKYISSQSSQ